MRSFNLSSALPSKLNEFATTYVTAEDVGMISLTRQEIVDIVRTLPAKEVLGKLSVFNTVLQVEGHDPRILALLAQTLLPAPLVDLVTSLYIGGKFRPWTTAWHLRILTILLLDFGAFDETPADPDHFRQVGLILLSISNSYRASTTAPRTQLEKSLDLEIHFQQTAYRAIDEAPLLALKEFIIDRVAGDVNLEDRIKSEQGFSPLELYTALGALWAKIRTFDLRSISQYGSTAIDLEYHLGTCQLGSTVGNYVLDEMTHDLTTPRSAPSCNVRFPSFSGLVQKPLLKFSNSPLIIACADPEMLFLRFSRCLWNFATKCRTATKNSFSSEAGAAFQEYCARILHAIEIERAQFGGTYYAEASLGKGGLDGLYIEGRQCIAFEFKSGLLPTSISYGTNMAALKKAIEEKYISGVGGAKSGFSQIASHLAKLRSTERGKSLLDGRSVRPCLVVEEPMLTSVGGYTYCKVRAAELFAGFSRVDSPVVVSFDDLNGLLERSRIASPCEVLNGLAKTDMRSAVNVRNAIIGTFAASALSDESRVPIVRETPVLDQVLERLKDNYIVPLTTTCEACGGEMFMTTPPGQECNWFCRSCGKVGEPLSDGDKEVQRLHYTSGVRWYRDH